MISIHASREGSDPLSPTGAKSWSVFQSTLPAREATSPSRRSYSTAAFQSTLPAREATTVQGSGSQRVSNFNPRFPRGKRRTVDKDSHIDHPFQSTLPAGEATKSGNRDSDFARFQSTLPAGEATRGVAALIYLSWGFQSTLPAGEATPFPAIMWIDSIISIHASRGGSDCHGRDRG